MQRVQVDDGDLVGVEVQGVVRGVGDVGPDQVLDARRGRREAADERVRRCCADGPTGPALVDRLVRIRRNQLVVDDVDQVPEAAHGDALDAQRPVAPVLALGQFAQARRDRLDDDRVLLALVLRIGEQERQQALGAELVDGPHERPHPGGPRPDVGRGVRVAPARRGQHPDAAERRGRQAECGVARRFTLAEADVGVVEEQQVLPLDVEHQRLGIGRLGTEHAGTEQRVEQERGVARLRGHATDAADVDVGALGAVDEVDIEVHRLAVAAEPGGQAPGDLVVVQRGRPLVADGAADLGAGQRRDEHLRHDPGDLDQRRLGDLRRQPPVGDEEHVALEPGPLVAGAHLGDDPIDLEHLPGGQDAIDGDDVVELDVLPGRDRHPELQRRGVVRPDHTADDWGARIDACRCIKGVSRC